MIAQSLISEIDENTWKNLISGVISKKLEKYKNLREESSRHWREISNRLYRFDKVQEEVDHLRSLSPSDLKTFYQTYVSNDGAQRRLLLAQVYGKNHPIPELPSIQDQIQRNSIYVSEKLDGLVEFKRTRPLYPVPTSDRLAKLSKL